MSDTAPFTMRRAEIEAIFDFMGGDFDVEVKLYSPSEFNPHRHTYFGVQVPSSLQPRFWIAVATWYCDQEHVAAAKLPDWTPIDLASDTLQVSVDHLYFDSFDFVEDF